MMGRWFEQIGWPGLFRRLGAAMLAIAFFLPVSSCDVVADITLDPTTVAVTETQDPARIRYRYPYKILAIDNPSSGPILIAFFWPLLALGYRKRRPRVAGPKFTILEAVLCLVSVWAVWSLTFLERPEIGGYVAFAGTALYLAAVLGTLAQAIKQWRAG